MYISKPEMDYNVMHGSKNWSLIKYLLHTFLLPVTSYISLVNTKSAVVFFPVLTGFLWPYTQRSLSLTLISVALCCVFLL